MAGKSKKRTKTELTESKKLSEMIFSQSAGTLISVFISVVFIWSCSYMFVDRHEEIKSVNDAVYVIDQQLAEVNTGSDMLQVKIHGWFSETDNLSRFASIITQLNGSASQAELDSVFVSNSVNWLASASLQLNDEKGLIDGYVFTDEMYKAEQKTVSNIYAQQILIHDKAGALLRNWSNETVESRNQKLSEITASLSQEVSLLSQSNSLTNQHALEMQSDKESDLRKLDELLNKLKITRIKTIVAFIGFVLGLLLIFFVFWYAYQKFFNKSKK